MRKKTGRSTPGTHTSPRRPRSAATTASATWSGVLENGAGDMPSVIRPTTKPGRTSSSRTPDPASKDAGAVDSVTPDLGG